LRVLRVFLGGMPALLKLADAIVAHLRDSAN
jgi:hypothetical protein